MKLKERECGMVFEKSKNKILAKKQICILICSGAFIGLLNGFFGGGGGMVCVPILEKVLNLSSKESHATAISVIFLPAVLSIIGISLAFSSRGKIKNGANTSGIVLNLITIFLCVAEYIIIAG